MLDQRIGHAQEIVRILYNTTLALLSFILLTALFSCESNFREVQRMGFSEFTPSFEAEDFDMKYTDSGRITSILKSKKMLDYATVAYPFTEFPQGVDVTFFDKNGKKTFVRSNYGINYKSTNVIDLQGNVRISSETGQLLETDQLYFDRTTNWFYTEQPFKFTDPKGVSHGRGIDFSRDFKIVNSQRITGEVDKSSDL